MVQELQVVGMEIQEVVVVVDLHQAVQEYQLLVVLQLLLENLLVLPVILILLLDRRAEVQQVRIILEVVEEERRSSGILRRRPHIVGCSRLWFRRLSSIYWYFSRVLVRLRRGLGLL